ncbi:MAG: hypothetical protein GY928_25120 [Colwellia sp.]|nr:hypothetical protein [Colwellia sp.]
MKTDEAPSSAGKFRFQSKEIHGDLHKTPSTARLICSFIWKMLHKGDGVSGDNMKTDIPRNIPLLLFHVLCPEDLTRKGRKKVNAKTGVCFV